MHLGWNTKLDIWVREVLNRPNYLHIENLAYTMDITDEQINMLFKMGCEFVDFTISHNDKLAIICTKPKNWYNTGGAMSKHCMID